MKVSLKVIQDDLPVIHWYISVDILFSGRTGISIVADNINNV